MENQFCCDIRLFGYIIVIILESLNLDINSRYFLSILLRNMKIFFKRTNIPYSHNDYETQMSIDRSDIMVMKLEWQYVII